MTTEHEARRIVRSWLQADEHESAERLLGSVLDRLDATPQRRPLWRASTVRFMKGPFRLAAGVATFAVVAAVGLALYFSRPAPTPAMSPSPSASPLATPTTAPTPSAPSVVGASGLVAYPVCAPGGYPGPQTCRIWVVNPDGTDAHELLPYTPSPDVPDYQNSHDYQYPIAWSPDGSQLLFSFSRVEYAGPQDGIGTVHSGLALTDAAGSAPDEFESLCPARPDVAPDQYNYCEIRPDAQPVAAFSPDGTRVAYVIYEDWGSGSREVAATALAILDLSTGSARRLDATETQGPALGPCSRSGGEGYNSFPAWSPDGTRLAFVRSEIGPPANDLCQTGLFTVNVDSGEVDELMLSRELLLQAPSWSLDGSLLLFHLGPGASDATKDAHVIRPDGSDLRALTTDGSSMRPRWTSDGRIVFLREIAPGSGRADLWIMDANGANASMLEPTVPELTAAGCVVCPYPINGTHGYFDNGQLKLLLWQPVEGNRP